MGRRRRLRTSSAIDEAFNGGVRFPGHCMVMWLRRGEDADLRLGVVVSRRTFRRAVDRNRAKRLLREAFRLNRGRLQGRVDVVLVGRQAILSETFGTIENDLMRLASKARLTAAGVQETQGGAREPSRRQPR